MTEAAIAALAVMRRWGMLLAAFLFLYAGAAALLGVHASVIIIINLDRPEVLIRPNLTVAIGAFVSSVVAGVGAVCLFRFLRAARATLTNRQPEDLERAMMTLALFWRVMVVAVIAVICSPLLVIGASIALFFLP